jgi:flagellar assembly factor FliW
MTSQFGEMDIREENIVIFPEGLIGFEEYKKFTLVFDKELEPFYWLLSIEEPEIELPLVNPFLFFPNYNPEFDFDTENHLIFSIITLKKDIKKITTNLKGPIIINMKKKEGKQIILNSDRYTTKHNVFTTSKE